MSDIVLSELTTVTKNGTGVFDVLMSAIQIRLDDEYNLNRIKDTDYAKVYLGSIEATITQSIQFLLGAELLGVQKDKILAEIQLVNAQKDKVAADILLAQQQLENLKIQAEILELQKPKTEAETALLEQKVKTEKAQILDNIDGASVVGMIGKQKALLTAQTDGFARKAEIDLGKLMVDSWSVRRTTDEGTIAPNGIKDDDISVVIEKAQEGIGVTPPV